MAERTTGQVHNPEHSRSVLNYEAVKTGLTTITRDIERTPRGVPVLDNAQTARINHLLRHPSSAGMKDYVRQRAIPLKIMDSDYYFPPQRVLEEEV